MRAVYKRELKSLFAGMRGWLFLFAMTLVSGALVLWFNVIGAYPGLEQNAQFLSLFYIAALPLFTMDTFAQEKRQGTDRLLNALPIKRSRVLLGKYFSDLTVLLIGALLSLAAPVYARAAGGLALAPAFSLWVHLFLLGAALLAVCVFAASLAPGRVWALAGSLIALILIRLLPGALDAFTPYGRLVDAVNGILNLNSLLYYIMLAALFVFLGALSIEFGGRGLRRTAK